MVFEPELPETLRIRVNSSSKRVAAFTKVFLENKLKWKFNFAVSTRNYLFLDFDCKGEFEDCLAEAKGIAKALVMRFGGEAIIYRTPNGYHLIFKRWFSWRELQSIIKALIQGIEEGAFQYLDRAHLEASLRRGYMTLRLNQIRKVWGYRYPGIELKW